MYRQKDWIVGEVPFKDELVDNIVLIFGGVHDFGNPHDVVFVEFAAVVVYDDIIYISEYTFIRRCEIEF